MASSDTTSITGAVPPPRTPAAEGRHEGHHHPADLTDADDDLIDAAESMYPEAGYALEHCHCFHIEGPHSPDDHPEPRA